jgi:hypothetical protein
MCPTVLMATRAGPMLRPRLSGQDFQCLHGGLKIMEGFAHAHHDDIAQAFSARSPQLPLDVERLRHNFPRRSSDGQSPFVRWHRRRNPWHKPT